MIQDLENLIKLQDIDLRIKEQELAKEQFPVAAANLTMRIEQAEAACGAGAAKVERLTSSISDIDAQTAKLRENLTRSQERLNSIKTNREYDAVHEEIETQKGMLGNYENKRKSLLEDSDKHTMAFEAAKKEFERIKSELQPQINDLNAKIDTIDSNIAEIEKERTLVEPLVTLHTRRTYDSIRKKRKNGKVVSVVNESKTCVLCFAALRPQLFNEIRRGNDFILCENCGSMLVWHE